MRQGKTVEAVPSADLQASGVKLALVANEAQAFGDVCTIDSSGEAALAKADVIANASTLVMCVDATVSLGATGTYMLLGVARQDAWAWTVGGLIYLSITGTTTNTLTQTAPSATDEVIQVLGIATHADRMIFSPNLTQVEHA